MLLTRDGAGDSNKARKLLDHAINVYRDIMPSHEGLAAGMTV